MPRGQGGVGVYSWGKGGKEKFFAGGRSTEKGGPGWKCGPIESHHDGKRKKKIGERKGGRTGRVGLACRKACGTTYGEKRPPSASEERQKRVSMKKENRKTGKCFQFKTPEKNGPKIKNKVYCKQGEKKPLQPRSYERHPRQGKIRKKESRPSGHEKKRGLFTVPSHVEGGWPSGRHRQGAWVNVQPKRSQTEKDFSIFRRERGGSQSKTPLQTGALQKL